jgi:hypothetical protein
LHDWRPIQAGQPLADQSQLDTLHARCVADMVAQTCRVMSSTTASSATRSVAPDTVVFVAGTGPVDAALFAELQSAGDAMCQTVRRHCTQDWLGKHCSAARAIYGLGT